MNSIEWMIPINAPKQEVFSLLTTDNGREAFWVEKSETVANRIRMVFPNGFEWEATIVSQQKPSKFQLRYIDNSLVTITLEEDEENQTLLKVKDEDFDSNYFSEIKAGWVSVMMNLKSVVETGHDLRNHDPRRTWDQNYMNN